MAYGVSHSRSSRKDWDARLLPLRQPGLNLPKRPLLSTMMTPLPAVSLAWEPVRVVSAGPCCAHKFEGARLACAWQPRRADPTPLCGVLDAAVTPPDSPSAGRFGQGAPDFRKAVAEAGAAEGAKIEDAVAALK